MRLANIILVLFFLIISNSLSAQRTIIVKGNVIDAETNQPVPYANVFFNNTTIGATTDSEGNYTIKNVSIEYTELLASVIGYYTIKIKIKPGIEDIITIDFKLPPKTTLLKEVEVRARLGRKDRQWRKDYSLFKEHFLGTGPNAELSDIENPEVLEFKKFIGYQSEDLAQPYESKKPKIGSETLIAKASEPLKIINRALGYQLSVTIEKFEASEASSFIVFNCHFDTLTSGNEREKARWAQNRMNTYKGSLRHLLKSIAEGRYTEEKFRIYSNQYALPATQLNTLSMNKAASRAAIYVDTLNNGNRILRNGVYQIHYLNKALAKKDRTFADYPEPVSWIGVSDPFITITSSGESIQPSDYWLSGYMNRYRISDMLPFDFNPEKEEVKLLLTRRVELASIRGVVTDENHIPLAAAEVFVNNGLIHTTTNALGQFEFKNLKPGRYPIGFAYGGMQERLVTFEVVGDERPITVQLKKREGIVESQKRDLDWELMKNNFEYRLTQRLIISDPLFTIVNPYVLNFNEDGDKIRVTSTAPLVIENSNLGYRWKYFIKKAELTHGQRDLEIEGLVKMDTLSNLGRRQQFNRYEKYLGSWNHFAQSLFEGRTEEEGFKIYQLKIPTRKRPLNFKKIKPDNLVALKAESLLEIEGERLYLKVPKGLEVHYSKRKADEKFYRHYNNQVMRIRSDSSRVVISSSGVIDPTEVKVTGLEKRFLPYVPVDMEPSIEKTTNPDVLVMVKNENLKSIKNLLEKVYIQTDRDYYHPADTIWLKAYFNYALRSIRDSLSKVLYVEFISPENGMVSGQSLEIINGKTHGDIVLPADLKPGDYYLRAYTNWMRNFDEYFQQPVPIILRDQFIQPNTVDTLSLIPNGFKINLTSNKNSYAVRDQVELNLKLDNPEVDKIAGASFSVSVIDQSASSDLGIPTIQSLKDPFQANGSQLIRIKYPLEKSLIFNGGVIWGDKDKIYTVNSLLLRDKQSTTQRIKGDKFKLNVSFRDTVSVMLKCLDEYGTYLNTEIYEKDSIDFITPPDPISYVLRKNAPYESTLQFDKKQKVTVFDEVFIKAKRIGLENNRKIVTPTQRLIGRPTWLIQGPGIVPIRKAGVLMNELSVRIPNFSRTASAILEANSQAAILDTSTRGATSFNAKNQNPLSALASSEINLVYKMYNFLLDGYPLLYEDFYTIPENQLSRIEVFYWEGIIALYTEYKVPFDYKEFDVFKLKGFSTPLTFKSPSLQSKLPDYRTTVYWNPEITTNENGEAKIKFNTTDVDGSYKVKIEGITAEGKPFRLVKLITVR